MKPLRQPMTPKERRQDQHAREAKARSETEADISDFKSGRSILRATELSSTEKRQKNASRCFGCDRSGFPLLVWEYRDVASGPAILCSDCSETAEADYRKRQRAASAVRTRPSDDRRPVRKT